VTAKKQKQPRKITRQYLENAALYYLQRYATTAGNFRRVMRRKVDRSCAFHKVPAGDFYPVIDDMISRYIASGLLNDKGFAEAKVSTLRRQGRSKNAIIAKLQAKGLSRDAAAVALGDEDGDDAEMQAALRFVKRKKLGAAKDPKARQKELAVLGRAGFSYETARAALEYVEDEEFT